ncbi:hypothetical protein HNO86_29840 [Pseudomonas sp. C1C7]|uniref:DUF6124 family protein n=1 Tax=Pseudomonas sp. C1C7 TaxID=2735272 RepID=UPI0015860974|nr:DUF6124 family protein [Pseudomonas sp. C1C7]NUT79253.1 hypothetical protein [Pseudomonas sp. C1C7]
MIKPTPNPPESESVAYTLLTPKIPSHTPSHIFRIAPDISTETLLAHASESLASASVMASDFATFLEGSQRCTLLGIVQVIMLSELAVNRALDNLDPP